jgi:2'-5' RNA ligase
MSTIKIYNLRIVPKNPVFNDAINYKNKVKNVFGKQPLSGSIPHMTIGEFLMDMSYENILKKAFNQLSQIPKFKLKANNLGVFDNSHTLYINIEKSSKFHELQKFLKIIWIRDLHRKLNSLKLSSTPHITISKFKNRTMMLENLELLKTSNYQKEFYVDNLVLTSRYNYETWNWEFKIPLK